MSMIVEAPPLSEEPSIQIPVRDSTARPLPTPDDATPGRTDFTPDYLLPTLSQEPVWYRRTWLAVAAVVVVLFGFVVFRYWAAADSGVDQNAYLVGGRLLAENHSLKYTLPNPYAYTGGMMVRVTPPTVGPDGRPLKIEDGGKTNPVSIYYPKYPFGLPLLYASFFWAFKFAAMLPFLKEHVDPAQAAYWAFIVSPASAVIGVAGMFFLARLVAGSFSAVLAAILLGTSQLLLMLADNPNSHASCMCFIVWGMYFCVRWMQTGSLWRGIVGGLLVGYAGIIRDNEKLLFVAMCVIVLSRLPWNQLKTWRSVSLVASLAIAVGLIVLNHQNAVAAQSSLEPRWTAGSIWGTSIASGLLITWSIAALVLSILRLGWEDWRMYLRAVVPGLTWAVPVVTLMIVNHFTMGNNTGYDSTHESEFGVAFQCKFFWHNWEKVVREFYDLGLFFVVPFSVAGVFMVFRRSWRIGVLLLAWLVPGVMLYMSYYWSPDFADAYARFFLTYLPALLVGAAVCFHDGILGGRKVLDNFDGPAAKVALVAVACWLFPGLLFWMIRYWHGGGDSLLTQSVLIYLPAAVALGAAAVHELPLLFTGERHRLGSATLTISVGMVVAIAAGVSAYRTIHGLRDGNRGTKIPLEEYRDRLCLAQTGQVLLAKVPAKSVLFAENSGGISSTANYIQFLRNWEMYSADAFSVDGSRRGFGGGGGARGRNRNGGGGRGNFGGPGGGGPGGPNGPAGANGQNDTSNPVATPVQPEQQEYHASLYRGMSASKLSHLQADVLKKAFDEHRQVFLLVGKDHPVSDDSNNIAFANMWGGNSGGVTADPLSNFKQGLNSVGRYNYKVVTRWEDVALPEDKEEDTSLTDNSPMGGGGGGGGGGGRGGVGMARMFMGNTQLMDWELVEITPR